MRTSCRYVSCGRRCAGRGGLGVGLTRFHFRSRWATAPWWLTLSGWLGIVPADFIMSRDMLRGVKTTAQAKSQTVGRQIPDPSVLSGEFRVAGVFVLKSGVNVGAAQGALSPVYNAFAGIACEQPCHHRFRWRVHVATVLGTSAVQVEALFPSAAAWTSVPVEEDQQLWYGHDRAGQPDLEEKGGFPMTVARAPRTVDHKTLYRPTGRRGSGR